MRHVVVRWIAWRWAIGPGQERLSPAGRPRLRLHMGVARSRLSSPHRHTSPNQCYGTPPSASAVGTGSTRRCAGTGSFRTEHLLGVVVNWPVPDTSGLTGVDTIGPQTR
jgi:hypothetical protein